MKKHKLKWNILVTCFLALICVITALPTSINAVDTYPSKRSISNGDIVFTKSAEWEDNAHIQDNYRAIISLKAENVRLPKYQPADIALLMSNSIYMFQPDCTNPGHMTLEEDKSEEVKKELDANWDKYVLGLPDNTGFTDSNVTEQAVNTLAVKVAVGGTDGYLKPYFIYTKEYGDTYRSKFKDRKNWAFVTKTPKEKREGNSLHFGEKEEIAAEILPNNTAQSEVFNLVITGKAGEKSGCNSGSAVSTSGAKAFAKEVLSDNKASQITLIPYGDTLKEKNPSFTSDISRLSRQIEEGYTLPSGDVKTKLPFQTAEKAFWDQQNGKCKIVVLITDDSIIRDKELDAAIAINDNFRKQGIATYVMGYNVTDQRDINQYLKPFAFDYNQENPDAECEYYVDTSLTSYQAGYRKIAEAIAKQKSYLIFTDYISEYFEVDTANVPDGLLVQEEQITENGSDTVVQKVTAKVLKSELDSKTAEVKIPVKLKDEYKNSQEFLNTNYIFSDGRKGAGVDFLDEEGMNKSLWTDSVYLLPDDSNPGPAVKKAALNYNLNGGQFPDEDASVSVEVEAGTKISDAPGYELIPVKKDWKFDGWYLDRQYKNPVRDTVMPEHETTIYARWIEDSSKPETVLLRYKLMGGKAPAEGKFADEKLIKGSLFMDAKDYGLVPVRDGYLFDAWYMEAACENRVSDSYILNADTSVYAGWIATKSKLIYMAYGGVLADGSNLEPELVEIGSMIADAPGYHEDIRKDGCQFGGWYMDQDYTQPVGTHKMPAEATQIHARWLWNRDITVDFGGGMMPDGSTTITVKVPSGSLIKDLDWYYSKPEQDGYTFGGWYKDSACTIPLEGNEAVTEDLKVYTKWLKNIHLMYDLQGGTPPGDGIFDPQIMKEGEFISNAKDYGQKPVREGYVFKGWYLEPECTNPVDDEKMPDSDRTIYAKWEVMHMLSYDLQGGNAPQGGGIDSEAMETGVLISSAAGYNVTPVKDGHTFDGWYLEKECIHPVDDTKMPDSDMTIYAKWIPKEENETGEPNENPKDTPKDNPPKEEPKEKDKTGTGNSTQTQNTGGDKSSTAKTGDSIRKAVPYVGLLGISGILLAVVILRRIRKRRNV